MNPLFYAGMVLFLAGLSFLAFGPRRKPMVAAVPSNQTIIGVPNQTIIGVPDISPYGRECPKCGSYDIRRKDDPGYKRGDGYSVLVYEYRCVVCGAVWWQHRQIAKDREYNPNTHEYEPPEKVWYTMAGEATQ